VFDEISFDRFHPKAERLYQVWVHTNFDNKIHSWKSLPLPTCEALKTADSNIKNAVITDWGGDHLLAVGDKKLIMNGMCVGEEFLSILEFPLLYGDASLILNDPTSIVITESTAQALFGNEDPMNKIIRVDDYGDMKVTGLLKDVPRNSSINFDFLLSWKYKRQIESHIIDNENRWYGFWYPVFVELNDPANKTEVENNIRSLLFDNGMEDMNPELFLYPLNRWRLYSNFNQEGKEEGGLIDFVQLFSLIALFIIVIACINFINLSTARSERRAMEVGVRKCIGSSRRRLVFQFIAESMIITSIAYLFAILIAQLLLPYYNNLVEKELIIDFQSWVFWSFSIILIFFTGIISGSYPAFYLSSFKPIKVLKGALVSANNTHMPRKILVTLQFGFSILLIIGTIVIYQQIQLVKNRQLGYNQANLIAIELNEDLQKNYQVIKNELLQTGIVEAATVSNSPITRIYSNEFLNWPGKPEDIKVAFAHVQCHYDYTATMGIKIIEGRDFSEDFISDSTAIILNKAALNVMKLKDPLGTQLERLGKNYTLIGIVDDVIMESPYHDVRPLFLTIGELGGFMSVRIKKNGNLQAFMKKIESVFNKYNPAYPFEYTFADVEFQEKFSTIKLTSKLASLFASLAIIITGLGLFGLASYITEQRTKEISIRKVMGATVVNIITLISKDFTRLVILAFILATPLAWWLLHLYLERYPIRIDIQFWIFPLTGILALVFALSIVITQALRSAHTNPANTLRNE
jgi:ABC-type antimicrobial peptide transport system permease subunit